MNIPGLSAEQIKLIRDILPSDWEIKLFGSRIKGKYRELSDLDICILSQVSRADIARITEKFEESNLPFTVDIVCYADCSAEFKKIIDTTGIKF